MNDERLLKDILNDDAIDWDELEHLAFLIDDDERNDNG